jgi:hypothetical protein
MQTSVVTMQSSPLIGATFSSDFVLLSTDPILTERLIGSGGIDTASTRSTIKSDVSNEQEMEDLIELMQGSGQLGGRAWAGDILVAINNEVLPTAAFFNSEKVISIDEIKIARKRSLEILRRSLGVNSSVSVEPLAADFSIVALGALLHNSDTISSSTTAMSKVTLDASLRSEGGGGSVCFAGGRFCTSLDDTGSENDNRDGISSDIGLQESSSSSLGTASATLREISSVLDIRGGKRGKGKEAKKGKREEVQEGDEAHLKNDKILKSETSEIVFTFRRSLVLPPELVPFSRHAAVAQALLRSSKSSSSLSSTTTSNERTNSENDSSRSDNDAIAGVILPNIERAILTCNRAGVTGGGRGGDTRRCSFKSADVAVVKASVLRSEVKLLPDPKEEESVVSVSNDGSNTELPLDKQTTSSSFTSSSSTATTTTLNAIPALFGGAFPCGGSKRIIFAGGYACDVSGEFHGQQPRSSEQPYAGAVVIATRGGCSFIDKANAVQSKGAAALLVVAEKGTPPIAMPAFEVDVNSNNYQASSSSSSSDTTGAAVLDPVTGRRKARKLHSEQKLAASRQRSSAILPVIAVAMIDYNDYIQLWKLSEFANSTGGITVAGFATDLNPDFDLCTSSSSSSSSSSPRSNKASP